MPPNKIGMSQLTQLHDAHIAKHEAACLQCGLTFAVLERVTPVLTLVAFKLSSGRTPDIHGVITPVGFSVNLADVARLTGPEKNKLKDVKTVVERM